jgi:hypothetical protein
MHACRDCGQVCAGLALPSGATQLLMLPLPPLLLLACPGAGHCLLRG